MATEEDLDKLRDELPEIWVEAMDVLRPLDLRQLVFGPRQLEIDLGVKSLLRPPGHGSESMRSGGLHTSGAPGATCRFQAM